MVKILLCLLARGFPSQLNLFRAQLTSGSFPRVNVTQIHLFSKNIFCYLSLTTVLMPNDVTSGFLFHRFPPFSMRPKFLVLTLVTSLTQCLVKYVHCTFDAVKTYIEDMQIISKFTSIFVHPSISARTSVISCKAAK